MVKVTLIDIDEETGEKRKVKIRLSFWSVMKMYLIGWLIVTGLIVGITVLARWIIQGML